MKIVCIGWGSLIWRPEGLQKRHPWFRDGPELPIEFTRISSDDRVTLIIDREAKHIQTLWAHMTVASPKKAMESLRKRERAALSDVHSVGIDEDIKDDIQKIVQDWLKKKRLDYAIWTGLSFSNKTKGSRPDIHFILKHLKNLPPEKKKRAEEYIRRAPKQTATDYRRQIELTFGWIPR